MKNIILTLLLASTAASQAASFTGLFTGGGVVTSNSSPLVLGTVRFGTFPGGFDIAANATNLTALDAAFIQFHNSITLDNQGGAPAGAIVVSDISVDRNGTYDGVSYAAGLANQAVFAWVLNGTLMTATEHGIFRSTTNFASLTALPPNDDILANFDASAGATASVGSFSGPVLPGLGMEASNRLVAVPEAGSSVLTMLAGLACLVRRRR